MPPGSLIPDRQLTFSPDLAATIGLEEAILLQGLGELLAGTTQSSQCVALSEFERNYYIRFGIARGVPMRSLYFKHALANTLVPVITIIGLQFGGVIAFSIVTESVFQWPGMGLLFLESIRFVDIPVMGVYLVVIAFFFVLVNLIVDLLYVAIDPRLRVKDTS